MDRERILKIHAIIGQNEINVAKMIDGLGPEWPYIHDKMDPKEVEMKRSLVVFRIDTFKIALEHELEREEYEKAAYSRDKISFLESKLDQLTQLYPITYDRIN